MSSPNQVFAFMDESGNGNPDQPLIVGAVVCDRERSDIEEAIRSRYAQLRARPGFREMERYDTFIEEGFHRSYDPFDVQANFIDLLISTAGFKAFLVATDRTKLTPAPEIDQLKAMYLWLTNTICRRFRSCDSVHFVIEQNDTLRPLLAEIEATVNRWLQQSGPRHRPTVTVTERPKQPDSLLAMTDYVMGVTAAWMRSGAVRDPAAIAYRQFRDVEGCLSLLYSLEKGRLSSRRVRSA